MATINLFQGSLCLQNLTEFVHQIIVHCSVEPSVRILYSDRVQCLTSTILTLMQKVVFKPITFPRLWLKTCKVSRPPPAPATAASPGFAPAPALDHAPVPAPDPDHAPVPLNTWNT